MLREEKCCLEDTQQVRARRVGSVLTKCWVVYLARDACVTQNVNPTVKRSQYSNMSVKLYKLKTPPDTHTPASTTAKNPTVMEFKMCFSNSFFFFSFDHKILF